MSTEKPPIQLVTTAHPAVTPPATQPPKTYTKQQLAVIDFRHKMEVYATESIPKLLGEYNIDPSQRTETHTFIQSAINFVKSDPKLIDAFIVNPASMFASILVGAEMGLKPSKETGEFFLIPRNIKQPDGSYKLTVCPQIGYKGLVAILLRSGDVVKLTAEVVYEEEFFKVSYGSDPRIEHEPNFDAQRTADKIKYAYATATLKNGEKQFDVVTRAQIEAVRDMSPTENALYFSDGKGANRWMEKKTALVQLSKMLPKDYYSKKGIGIDGMVDGGGTLTLNDRNEIVLIENSPAAKIRKPSSRFRNIYDTLDGTK